MAEHLRGKEPEAEEEKVMIMMGMMLYHRVRVHLINMYKELCCIYTGLGGVLCCLCSTQWLFALCVGDRMKQLVIIIQQLCFKEKKE